MPQAVPSTAYTIGSPWFEFIARMGADMVEEEAFAEWCRERVGAALDLLTVENLRVLAADYRRRDGKRADEMDYMSAPRGNSGRYA